MVRFVVQSVSGTSVSGTIGGTVHGTVFGGADSGSWWYG